MQKDKQRLIILPYAIYIVYSIAIIATSIHFHWSDRISMLVAFGMIMCFVLNLIKGIECDTKRICLAVLSWMNMILFIYYDKSLMRTIPTMLAFIILFSLFDIHSILYISFAGAFVTFLLDVFLAGNDFATWENAVQTIESFLPVVFVVMVELYQMNLRFKKKRQLDDTIKELKVAEQGKTDFMANISHEIRTPLNTIYGLGTILQEKPLSDDVKEDVCEINIASRHLMTLVSDILDFTEVENNSIEIMEEPYNLTSVINDVMNMAEAWNAEKGLELIIDADPQIPCSLLGDGQKLYRVLLNIVNNAIKFTDKGGVRITLNSRPEKYGVNLNICIQDSGIGLSEEGIENLGNIYNQINTKRDRRFNGIGLGLTISRYLISRMNGFMDIQSVYGEGTTVTIILPQKVVSKKAIVSLESTERLHVLSFIDMEKFSSAQIREWYMESLDNMMCRLGIEYRQCNTMKEVKRRFKKENYEFIFTADLEYQNNKAYFDGLSDITKVIVFTDKHQNMAENKAGIYMVQKPLRISTIVSVLNGSELNVGHVKCEKDNICMPSAKILAVDDVAMNLKVLSAILKKYHITIDTAVSGKEAISKVKTNYYDLVFMDHMMPVMDGVETLHAIRTIPGEQYRTVPIVALTANAVGGAREMFLREGFDDFVAKPIEKNNMERVLLKFLSNKLVTDNTDEESEAANMNVAKDDDTDITKELAQIDAIDLEAGMMFCGGEIEDYLDILKDFLNNVDQKIKELQQLWKDEDIPSYTINVHSLKGLTATIGAKELSEMARQLQSAAEKNDLSYIQENHQPFMDKLRILVTELKSVMKLPQETVENTTSYSCLNEIEDALKTFDQIEVLNLLGKLTDEFPDDEAYQELFEQLRQCMDQFDFFKAEEILTEFGGGMNE